MEDLIKKIAANRTALRDRLVNFLTLEQLTRQDAALANAKEFLGQFVPSLLVGHNKSLLGPL